MAVPLLNCTVLEQRAVIRSFTVRSGKNIGNLQENFSKGLLSKRVLLREYSSCPIFVLTVVEANRPLKYFTPLPTHTHTHVYSGLSNVRLLVSRV